MTDIEKDFKVEDMKGSNLDRHVWRDFVKEFGSDPYLWLCNRVNGGSIYVREAYTELRPARERASQKKVANLC